MRRTVTLTAPNGAKVRTALGKSFYVVRYGDLHVRYNRATSEHVRLDPPEAHAEVAKRTDSALAAERLWKHIAQAEVFAIRIVAGEVEVTRLSRRQLSIAAEADRRHRKFEANHPRRAV